MARSCFVLVILLISIESSQQNDSDFVSVEVSPFNSSSDARLERISKECAELGICEKSAFYPKQLAQKLREKIDNSNLILDTDDPNNLQILEGSPMFTSGIPRNPCKVERKTMKPMMVRDVNGLWHYSLNGEKPLQEYNVEICQTTESDESHENRCVPLVPDDSFQLKCIQKFIVRTILVIQNNDTISVPSYIPCCCTCVAIPNV